MTLWCAAGASVAAVAVSLSGGETGEAIKWLVDLCLTGPMDGDMPMIAMEAHRSHPSPTIGMGLALIAAALIAGGLWPGAPAAAEDFPADPDKMLAAMSHMASATGGISPPELATQVTAATGLDLSVDEATLALRSYREDAEEDALAWIATGEPAHKRDIIIKAALKVGWTHGEFTPGGLVMAGRLARAMGINGEDLALLFWEVTEAPAHEQDDPLRRLRPRLQAQQAATPAMA